MLHQNRTAEPKFQLEFSEMFSTDKVDVSKDCKYFAFANKQSIEVPQIIKHFRLHLHYFPTFTKIRQLGTYDYKKVSSVEFSTQPSDIAFSPDSSYLLVVFNKQCCFEVYDLACELITRVEEQPYGTRHATWAPDSRQVLSFSAHNLRLSIYNMVDRSVAHIRCPKHCNGKGMSFSSDGKFMALAEKRQEVKGRELKEFVCVYSTNNWTLLNCFIVDFLDLADLQWAPDDTFIVAWDNPLSCKLFVLCPLKGVIARIQPYENGLGIRTVSYSHKSQFVAVGSYDQKIRLIHALNWTQICELECPTTLPGDVNVILAKQKVMEQGKQVYSVFECQDSMKIPVSKVIQGQNGPNQGINILQFSYDDKYLAARNENMPSTVWIWQLEKLALKAVFTLEKHVKSLMWHPCSNTLFVCTGTKKVYMWQESGPGVFDIPYENSFVVKEISWALDGQHLVFSDKGEACLAHVVQ